MKPYAPTLVMAIPVLVSLATLGRTVLLILMTVPVVPVKMEALAWYGTAIVLPLHVTCEIMPFIGWN